MGSRGIFWCVLCFSLMCTPFTAYSYYSISENGRLVESTYPSKKRVHNHNRHYSHKASKNYGSRHGSLPSTISTSERVIVIDPRLHAWGAYDSDGKLLRTGLATAGGKWCADIRRSCRTKVGVFRIQTLGPRGCRSSLYPLPRGGAPMPYCMFFNGRQGLHGSYQVVAGNISHGCVRVHVPDAEWIRFNFARIGTKVIVRPY